METIACGYSKVVSRGALHSTTFIFEFWACMAEKTFKNCLMKKLMVIWRGKMVFGRFLSHICSDFKKLKCAESGSSRRNFWVYTCYSFHNFWGWYFLEFWLFWHFKIKIAQKRELTWKFLLQFWTQHTQIVQN